MKPYFEDNLIRIYNGDARNMSELPDGSVQCCVTSPPYWGLRRYSGLPDLIWGDNKCGHRWDGRQYKQHSGRGDAQKSAKYSEQSPVADIILNDSICSLCGAWKGQYGLEPTPEMYIEHTIEILREIRRVLRPDGVVFWNIGDSYNAGREGGHAGGKHGVSKPENAPNRSGVNAPNLKPKDLCLIPFRVAIAAQEDGWYVRSVIIWSKNNPMPESVRDRCTESHEYILHLTKSARYYWDMEAVREPYTEPLNRWGGPEFRDSSHKYIELGGHDGQQHYGATSMFRKGRPVRPIETGRNIRSVWEFPTQPYPEAHFAVFPEKLPEICIKASTPEVGCCSKCGAPWVRIIEKVKIPEGTTHTRYNLGDNCGRLALHRQGVREEGHEEYIPPKTLGWQPTCQCNADKIPSIVLDPFAGSGTTLAVAKREGREAIGYELSLEYCKLAKDRIESVTPPLPGLFV